ncbi:MAG: glycosyltransferase family 4 protein [Chloroflexi bacterium]|nr:glycosyltransferase family 4 protein [Chloroflexota bacterium]
MVAVTPSAAAGAAAQPFAGRVALVARKEPGVTGTSRFAATLLQALHASGTDVALTPLGLGPLMSALAGAGRRAQLDLVTFFGQYPLAMPRRDVDVYHLATQTLATLCLRRRDRPVVVTVHDIIPYLLRHETELRAYGHAVHRWFDYAAMRGITRAAMIAADSEWTRQSLVRELRIPHDRVRVVRLGIDSALFRPTEPDEGFWERYSLRPERPFALYVGSEDPRKNLASLIRAMAQVPDLQLVKVGAAHHDGEHARLVALAGELGLGQSVHWLRHVPESDLPRFYTAAGVVVLPSMWEGFGLPVLEAMACGTRVVCADATSLPELAGADSIVCEPTPGALAEAMQQALRGHGEQPAEARIEWARSFTWQRTADEMNGVYAEAVARG